MMEKMIAMQQKRRSRKGGFTLVELIVVLVILAILAALLIPALTGYIDRAKEKNVIAETRQCVMAAQTLYDEAYANVKKNGTADIPTDAEILKLAELTDKGKLGTDKDKVAFDGNKVSHLVYTNNGVTCTYNGSTYDCAK
ncbi:prepilin-type N-terminal cleavage/methylation domain-containing protein [Agathobaculum sp.]|uniref:prepilin-type N-terminal cleavage/methylation domain-containing protein n=1 Tax=Agathobaculum sp. TaxID=2048138 RepID=UPI00307CB755